MRTTPEALKAITTPETVAVFGKYGVLSEKELDSRYEVYLEAYEQTVHIEASCAVTIARTMIAPAAIAYQAELAEAIKNVEAVGSCDVSAMKDLLARLCEVASRLLRGVDSLETSLQDGFGADTIGLMLALREPADELEGLLPDELWPLPSYAEMMFMM